MHHFIVFCMYGYSANQLAFLIHFLRRELLWILSQKAHFTPGLMLIQRKLYPPPSAFRKEQNPSCLNWHQKMLGKLCNFLLLSLSSTSPTDPFALLAMISLNDHLEIYRVSGIVSSHHVAVDNDRKVPSTLATT